MLEVSEVAGGWTVLVDGDDSVFRTFDSRSKAEAAKAKFTPKRKSDTQTEKGD